jgi:hypothetical protein
MIKLIDQAAWLDALLEDSHPLALVTAARLLKRQTRGNAQRR